MDSHDDGDTTTVHTQDIIHTAASMLHPDLHGATGQHSKHASAPGALCLRDRMEEGRCRRDAFYFHTGKKSGWCS